MTRYADLLSAGEAAGDGPLLVILTAFRAHEVSAAERAARRQTLVFGAFGK
jgi:hypothetical protein